jgi:hypothetical protein
VLDVFAVFFDECGTEGLENFAELRDEFCADELFYGAFFFGFGVDVDFELGLLDFGYLGVVGGEETYNVLVGLGVVGHLWDGDTATNIFAVLCLACMDHKHSIYLKWSSSPTFILKAQFDVEYCDDLAFPLAHINISVH